MSDAGLTAFAAFGGAKGGFGRGEALAMKLARRKALQKLPIFVLYQPQDGSPVRRCCYRADADKVRNALGERARRALVVKFLQRHTDLGLDAKAFIAKRDTALCRRDFEERQHRDGVAVLEVVLR